MSKNDSPSRPMPDLQSLRDAIQAMQAPAHHHTRALERFSRRRTSGKEWFPLTGLAGALGMLLLFVFWPDLTQQVARPLNPGVSRLTIVGQISIPRMSDLNSPTAPVPALPARPKTSISFSFSPSIVKHSEKREV